MKTVTVTDPRLNRKDLGMLPTLALAAAVVGIIISVFGLLMHKDMFFRAYLVGYMFWLNMGLGSLLLLMIQHLSGGAWGVIIRRVLESSVKNIWWMALFFIPVLLGMHSLYEWTHLDIVKHDHVLQLKEPYLNTPFFIARLVVYFLVWIGIAFLLVRWSTEQDRTANPRIPGRMRNLSGPGIVLFFLCMTFAGVDWLMSLEPHYYSTMYGPIVMIGQVLGAMAFTIAIIVLLMGIPPLSGVINVGHLHDLGKLMFAFTMFWAYINFSAFLITWSANLAEEVPWYMRRMTGGWQYIAAGLIAFHFVVPFLFLLSRHIKRNPRTLIVAAIWIIAIRFVDLSFLIMPSAMHDHAEVLTNPRLKFTSHLNPLELLIALGVMLAIGGVWLTMFFRNLASRPLLPVNDPYLQEAINFHGGH